MAHYLFASTPLYGHVAPMIAAGRALMEAGHRVTMLTGSRFEAAVRGAGLGFVALSGRADFDERDLESYLPDRARHRGVALSQYQIQHTFIHPMPEQWWALRGILDTQSVDALAVDHLFAGAVPLLMRPRAERIPVLAFGIGPVAQLSRDAAPPGMALQPSWSIAGRLRNRALNLLATHIIFRDTQKLARRLIHEAIGKPLPASFPFILDLSRLFDRLLQLGPREFEYPLTDFAPSLRFVGPLDISGASFAPALPHWWDELEDGRPIIHVTQGTVDNSDFSSLIQPALRGLADIDGHVVITTGGAPLDTLGPLPANAKAAPFLPYDRLIPRLSALVTNGGCGTTMLALRHGVPLVIAPGAEDKPEVAARVEYFGVGINLRTARPEPDRIAEAVRAVMGPSSQRERARAMADAIRHYRPCDTIRQEFEALVEHRAHHSHRRRN